MLTFQVKGKIKAKGFASSPGPDWSTDPYNLGTFYAALCSTLLSLCLQTDDGLVYKFSRLTIKYILQQEELQQSSYRSAKH